MRHWTLEVSITTAGHLRIPHTHEGPTDSHEAAPHTDFRQRDIYEYLMNSDSHEAAAHTVYRQRYIYE